MDKPFKLKRPCENCPFRTDVHPYLTKDRAAEIVGSMDQGTFDCHKTLDYETPAEQEDWDGQPVRTAKSAACAGALIMLEKAQRPSRMMIIATALGLYDRTRLDNTAPVYETPEAFIAAQPED